MRSPVRRATLLALVVACAGGVAVVVGGRLDRPGLGTAQAPDGKAAPIPLELFVRRLVGVGPDVQVEISPARPGPVPGVEAIDITLPRGKQTQKVELHRTTDGRYIFWGPVLDTAADPFADVARRIDLAGRPTQGRADAPLTVVEYSDFQCPFCKRMSPVVHETMKAAIGKDVRWVFKHFPLASIHPWAENAAVGAECARQVGGDRAFWALHDHLFDTQEGVTAENLRDRLVAWAKGAGLPTGRVERCLDEPAARARVQADMREAGALGVSSTPTLVINGRLLPGALSADQLNGLLEQELTYQRALGRARGGS